MIQYLLCTVLLIFTSPKTPFEIQLILRPVYSGLVLLAYYGNVLGSGAIAATPATDSTSSRNASDGVWAAALVFLGRQSSLLAACCIVKLAAGTSAWGYGVGSHMIWLALTNDLLQCCMLHLTLRCCYAQPQGLSSAHTTPKQPDYVVHRTGYSVVQGPRTSMARPHPALWRLVHGAAVLYVLMLVWLLLQTVQDARQFLKVGFIKGEARGRRCLAIAFCIQSVSLLVLARQ